MNASSKRELLDTALAAFYGVVTKAFNQQVRRNLARYPLDFMFLLNDAESAALSSQFVTLKNSCGQHRKYLPLAFTEHGAIRAAAILCSPRATEVSVPVVRTFIELRNLVTGNKELASKMKRLERKVDSHDQAITGLIDSMHRSPIATALDSAGQSNR